MSSYLTNLMLRTQQAADVVRPRLPSLFEPPAALPSMPHRVAQLERDQTDGPEERRGLATLTIQGESERLSEPRSQSRISDTATLMQMVPAWRGLQVIAEAHGSYDPAAQTSSARPANSADASNAGERGGPRSAHGRADSDARQSDERQSERAIRQENQPHALAHAPRPQPPSAVHVFADAAGKPSAVSENAADTRDRRVVAQPRVGPLLQPASGSGNAHFNGPRSRREQITQQAAEPPTPTINVTIGRIEIKALTPAAAPPQPRKPQPSLMSLDEYMRRRNAGGDLR